MANRQMKDIKNKKIVCLGGGIGTVNLIRGLKEYTENIAVVVSMADDGGSSGRLRRLYKIFPPGDMVSCMSALIKKCNLFLCTISRISCFMQQPISTFL